MSPDLTWLPARGGSIAVAEPRPIADTLAALAEWARDDRPAKRVPWEGEDQ